jgi:penicillin-binding protein 1C
LFGRAAAFLTAEILKDPGRLPFLAQLTQARENLPVAFKTGTSFGMRDAWTATYTPSCTVVIWFGRADGGPDARLLGLSLAAPAAIRIQRALNAGIPPEEGWYQPPTGQSTTDKVGRVRVCSLSGAAPSAYCPSTRETWNIPGVWRTVPCKIHALRDGKTVLLWPPELEDFNRKRFAGENASRSVLIVSPLPGARYLITPGARRQPIPLKAEGVRYPVHWYADGEYLGEQKKEDAPLYWSPKGGQHRLSLLDAQERIGALSVPVTDLAAVREAEIPVLGE